jgi:hypothetical protein
MINVMEYFAKLDDYDIITSIKTWSDNSDRTLSILCQYLLNRKLYKVKIQNNPFDIDEINAYHKKTQEFLDLKPDEVKYFTGTDSISNFAYDLQDCKINVLFKNGELIDISSASDMLNTEVLSKTITKYFMYYPKALTF